MCVVLVSCLSNEWGRKVKHDKGDGGYGEARLSGMISFGGLIRSPLSCRSAIIHVRRSGRPGGILA